MTGVSMSGDSKTPRSGSLIDVVVVIDVIRAFTTACVLFARGASEVVCARDQGEAARIGAGAITVGETRFGAAIPGVIPNSPVAVRRLNVNARRAVLFTLNGTRSLHCAPACTVLMAAAAANAAATAQWILTHVNDGRIHLVVSDPEGPEDYACARYLAGQLDGVPVDPEATSREIMAARWAHWDRWGATVGREQWRNFEADVDVCARVDSHPIAMIADLTRGRPPTLRAVSPDASVQC
jgi:2-phosphosulfolactate phosphatase